MKVSHIVYKLENLNQNVFKYVQTLRNTVKDCNWSNKLTMSVLKGTLSVELRNKVPQTSETYEDIFDYLFALKYTPEMIGTYEDKILAIKQDKFTLVKEYLF